MKPIVVRGGRIAAVALAVFAVLWLRFSAGIWPDNEVSGVIHWGLFPIALLLAFGAWALESSGSGSPARRDSLFGISGAIVLWAVLRIFGSV